jgi:hypothetical protein
MKIIIYYNSILLDLYACRNVKRIYKIKMKIKKFIKRLKIFYKRKRIYRFF